MHGLGYTTGVYKPFQTNAPAPIGGFTRIPDFEFFQNVDKFINLQATYLFQDNVSAIVAAEEANSYIDKYVIKRDFEEFSNQQDCTIIDGNGGLLEPVAPSTMTKDIIQCLNIPLLFVITPDSENINNAILSINTAINAGIEVRGVIINDYPTRELTLAEKSFPRLIEEFTDTKILGLIGHFENPQNINPTDLITSILNGIDIESVFNLKIAKLEIG